MRIAICDDDPQELIWLSALLDAYQAHTNANFMYSAFSNAMVLLDEVRSGDYDLLILDVLMPIITGMEAAHEVRSFNKEIEIVFLTSSPEFAVESYAVRAYGYLLKPLMKEALFAILNQLFSDREKPEEGLSVKFQSGTAHILFSRLVYVEVLGKKLRFHLTDGTVQELTSSLSQYEDRLLSREEYIKVHRSFIVNLWQIQELVSEQIRTHGGKIIPVSRRFYPQVREAYMKHLFFRKGMVNP